MRSDGGLSDQRGSYCMRTGRREPAPAGEPRSRATAKQWLLARLVDALYPSIYLWPNPFKIYEYQIIMAAARLRPDDVVLDLGCGAGLHAHTLARRCRRVVGLDVAHRWIRRAEQERHRLKPGMDVSFVCAPLEKAGFAEGTFDRIFSFSVLEHIANYEEVLAECRHVLKQGGRLHFSVDWLGAVREPDLLDKHRRDHHVVRYFSPAEMEDLLKRLGFADIRVGTFVRTPPAIDLFKQGIREEFVYSYRRSWAKAWALRRWESRAGMGDRGEAVCLHVEAAKP